MDSEPNTNHVAALSRSCVFYTSGNSSQLSSY